MVNANSLITSVDTTHEDQIHDCQFDFYGTRLATASSDKSIKVFEVHNDKTNFLSEIRQHDGPVWQVSWAHPKYGALLASASFDTKLKINREGNDGQWSPIFTYEGHRSSVNTVQFAPAEFGLVLACGSTDGDVSILTGDPQNPGHWDHVKFPAHKGGVNSISWAPCSYMGSLCCEPTSADSSRALKKRIVTAGCDNLIKIWEEDEHGNWVSATPKGKEMAHNDWVRDVAWAPSTGLDRQIIASCDHDGEARVWIKNPNSFEWDSKLLKKFDFPLWHVSWSVTGNILAVSGDDNHVSLWRESPDRSWNCISDEQAAQ